MGSSERTLQSLVVRCECVEYPNELNIRHVVRLSRLREQEQECVSPEEFTHN